MPHRRQALCALLCAILLLPSCAASEALRNAAAPIAAAADDGTDDAAGDASYTTKYSIKSAARAHNIALAAEAIDDTLVPPNAVFSFNEAVGPTTKARGYQKARVFQNGLERKNYGGGVCQVSSTLYNAALALDLEIVERHPHSKPVGYVPEGRDAATSYGVLDFQFRNTLPYPLLVRVQADQGALTAAIVPCVD